MEVIDSFKLGIDNWRNVVSKVNANILTDSSRFENKQLPTSNTIENKVGFISTPEKNTTENAYSFIYVTAIHNNPEQRSFDEARGFVTSDYQLVLEQKWINNLKKKYPIVINQAVWKTVK